MVEELPITLQDIEDSFDAILSDPSPQAPTPADEPAIVFGERPEDRAEVESLFRQIAAAYLGPVRDFMVEMQMAEPPKEWLQVCTPAVTSLAKSATGMGLDALTGALDVLAEALRTAEQAPGSMIVEPHRQRLLTAYEALVTLLPEAFAVEGERDRREPIIVQSLLKQIPEVRKVALDKIYSAGLTTLKMFYVAKPQDIADATGLPIALAERIVVAFMDYKRDIASIAPDAGRSGEHDRLKHLTSALKMQTTAFENTSDAKEKRRLRQQRNDTVLQIQVLLARLGEIGMVERLEKMPFARKVEELERYLTTKSS